MVTPWKSIEESAKFKRLSKAEKLNAAQEWIRNTDSELKAADGYTPEYSARLGEFGAGILKNIIETEEEEGGFWKNVKNFASDLAAVPSEMARGAESTSDQIRMFGNFLQGDEEELESLYRKQYAYEPLPEVKSTVGRWVRGAASTLPYMGASAGAGAIGGLGGSLAAPGIGTTAGAGLGAAAVGFAQGWGEMYGRLRNEGIEPGTAADIALAVAPAYAGIEAAQIRKLPGAAQLADKYLTGAFKKMLSSKLADRAFKGKVQRALGKYAGEIISQSAEEGAQEMALNAGEQYGRNGGFQNFDFGENLGAGTEAFKESVGPFAVIQGANVPIRLARRAMSPQATSEDFEALKKAVEEGKNIQEESEGTGLEKNSIGDGGVERRNADGTEILSRENGGAEGSETAYLERDLAEEKKAAEELSEKNKIAGGKKEKTYTSEIAKNIDALDDENARLDAIEFEYEQGNIGELTDDQLEFAAGHGYEFAERELFKRAQEGNSGTKLLDFMKQNNIRLPTPAAIRRHAAEHNRGLGTYLYGEIKDLYDSLPFNLRGRYFTKNYVNLDETAQELADYGFRFDGESDFITKVADNLWGKETSYGFSIKPKRLFQSIGKGKYAGLNDDELVKAHMAAFNANDEAAGREINAEWMRRKGYETKAYHGTGADGFNVADASSKYEENGEGAQAHGPGLYMAADRNIAEGYRESASGETIYYRNGEEIDWDDDSNWRGEGLEFAEELIEIIDSSIFRGMDETAEHFKRLQEHAKEKRDEAWELTKKYIYKKDNANAKYWHDAVNDWNRDIRRYERMAYAAAGFRARRVKFSSKKRGGRVFDWFHNMKPDELLDEQLPFSKQNAEVKKKLRKLFKDNGKDLAELMKTGYVRGNPTGGQIYGEVQSVLAHGSEAEASRLLSKYGIKGITYDGRQDGRAFVSFEGGPAVKLQDAFTFDDGGKYIPLNKRGDSNIPDMRYSIKEDVAQKFKRELQDYIDGKLDNRHVFRLGTTPEVMRLAGADDLPLELAASVLSAKEAKHNLNIESLKKLPEELADPIAIFQSAQIPNGLLVITEIPDIDGKKIAVAVHLDKTRNRNRINDIRSIHGRSDFNIQTQADMGLLRYINTKRRPYSLRLNRVAPVSGSANKAFNKGRVFTESDLSQAEKENIFKLRGINPNKEEGRKLLQDANSAGRERRETELAPFSPKESDKLEKSQVEKPQPERAKIKNAVETSYRQMYKNAARKPKISWVNTAEELRKKYPQFKEISDNCEAAITDGEITFVADNLESPRRAVEVFLHESVGHFGLEEILGEDFKPFVTYITKHYKGKDLWNEISERYATKDNKIIAREMIAHLAESRELSDPSMWRRMTEYARRKLGGLGLGKAYSEMLNEEILRSAIRASRQWSKGDLSVNNAGVWENVHAGKDTEPEREAMQSIKRSGAERFRKELQEYIDGKLDNKHIFKLGTTPEVLKLAGADDLPLELAASVLAKKENKHSLVLEDLKRLPEELADPIAVFQSETIPNGLVILTELPTKSGNSIIVAVHLNSKFGRAEINSIRSVYDKKNSSIVNWGSNGDVLYLNTKKRPSWLKVPVLQSRGQLYNQNGLIKRKVFTESDLSQEEKENISNLRKEARNIRQSVKQFSKAAKANMARNEISSFRARTIQATIDKYHPLAVLERVVKGDIQDASKSAWKMALMTANTDQVMFHALEKGGLKYDKNTGEFSEREGVEGLAKIFKPIRGKNYRNFENYAKAKSALERWEFLKNKENFKDKRFSDTFGFAEGDARKWENEGNAASKKSFEQLQKFFQSNRDFMLETGLISESQHAALSKFKNYVPFFREGKDLEAEAEAAYERATELFPGGKGFSGRNAGIRKFEGSSRTTKNLVENIVNQTRRVMDAGYKNIAAARSLNLMREAGLAKYIRQDSAEAKAKMADLKRSLEKEGIDVGELSDEDIRRKVPIEAYFDILNDKNDDIVSCRVNGMLAFYKVEDPELLVAVKNLGGEKFSKAWKLLTGPKNLMTFAITKLPQFAIRNFIRDTGSNAILFGGKTIVPYMAHTVKNLGKSVFSDGHLQKMWAAGAGGGSWYSVKADDIASDFKDSAWNKVKRAGKYTLLPISKVFEKYERLLSASEQANRLSRFDQAKKAGASDMEAAFQAMDVLNFGMRGSGVWTGKNEWAKAAAAVFNAIVRITPFLNARIQGLYKLWRETGADAGIANQIGDIGVKNRTRSFVQTLSKAVLMRGMMMSAASVLYSIYANNSEDDDGEKWYEKLPTHDKLNYWHFYLGGNNIVRIPKPFEVGYVFATIPELMTDTIFQKRPEMMKTLWKGMVQQLEFNPLANPIFDTFAEQTNNKDSFTGRPLIEYADRELSPKYQYDADTSATAKAIAQVFGSVGLDESWLASPARVQNVMGNLLAGMTKYVTAMTDSIVESLTDIEGGTSRYARESVFEAPYSWAMRNTRTMNTKNSEDFYELRARTREIYGAARLLRQEKKMEQLQNLIDRHKAELGNYNYVNAVNTRLAEISRARKALSERKDLSNAEIIHQDDLYLAERNRLLAMTDILLDNLEKGKFDLREFKDILSRIKDAGKDRKASRKSQRLIQRLAQME